MKNIMSMWLIEIKPLCEEFEAREFRANHYDRASAILETIERFESVIEQYEGN